MNYFDKVKNIIEEKEVNEKVRYLESNKYNLTKLKLIHLIDYHMLIKRI